MVEYNDLTSMKGIFKCQFIIHAGAIYLSKYKGKLVSNNTVYNLH